MSRFVKFRQCLVAACLVAVVSVAAFGAVEVDPELPAYQPVEGVTGSIKTVGSDTMNNLMTSWGEAFAQYYPSVVFEIEGKGSNTAPAAMIAGVATFGPMSRTLKDEEQNSFEHAFGYKATQLGVAIDMLAVFVNKDNPIEGLTLPQLDAIFSSTRKSGYKENITTWGQLGLTGLWADTPISLYGRNSASGTYLFFLEHVLNKGDFKVQVKEQPGSSAVVQSIANDRSGIGYSGIGYETANVRAVPLAAGPGEKYIPPTAEFAYTCEYPLARFLLLTVNYKPGGKLDPLRREFVKFILSKQGQEIVAREGYFPVTEAIARQMLDKVGISE